MSEENDIGPSVMDDVKSAIAETEQANSEPTTQEATQQALDWLENFKDYQQVFEFAKQNNVDEVNLIKTLLNAQLMYQSNPKAFTLALVQQHIPELFQRLQQVQQQQAQNEQAGIEDEELDEEERQLKEALAQIQERLNYYDNYFINQQANEYYNMLEELSEELPLLKNPQIGMKIAEVTNQFLQTGIATDFKDAVRRAYRAVVADTSPSPQKPLRPASEPSNEIEVDDDASVYETVRSVMRQLKL